MDLPAPQTASDQHPPGRQFLLFQAVPAWLISMLLHMLLLLVLALLTFTDPETRENILSVASLTDPEPQIEQFTLAETDPGDLAETQSEPLDEMVLTPPTVAEVEPRAVDPPMAMLAETVDMADLIHMVAPDQLLQSLSAATPEDLGSRSGSTKRELLRRYGGTEASEAAVAKALKWLALHQLPNGAWTFKHTAVCRGIDGCGDPGEMKYDGSLNAATALGVLPFLGAGQTQLQGTHKDTVRAALRFLIQNGKVRQLGGLPCLDLSERGGTMYSHGLASIALCEAYAMTEDPLLRDAAQMSLNYIAWAQDPAGGGWRYGERQPGDTSVTGWQVMALKSGHMGHLVVLPQTINRVHFFLDSVSFNNGAAYYYMAGHDNAGGHQPCTPIGLLCRMYLGVEKSHPAIRTGVAALAEKGIDKKDIYYNYYAAQVLRHHGGPEWDGYNRQLRDWLVQSQVSGGHADGSWHWPDSPPHRGPTEGGRLCSTALATMILEVYYRHMPLYADAAAEDDFPL